MQYKALQNILHNGVYYQPGQELEMSQEAALDLVLSGVLSTIKSSPLEMVQEAGKDDSEPSQSPEVKKNFVNYKKVELEQLCKDNNIEYVAENSRKELYSKLKEAGVL